jgi:membrane-bound lytic murein transglycosylase MltF
MNHIKTCQYLMVFLLTSFSSFSSDKIQIAYVDVPPYAYQDANNQANGLLIDSFREIVNSIGVEAEFIYLPHRRLISFIEQGKIDLWAGQVNSQVKDDLALVSETPLFVMNLHVYWNKGAPRVESLQSLHGKKLILISSYAYGGNYSKLVKNSDTLTYAINHEDGFEKLLAGNSQYLLAYQKISQEIIDKFQITEVDSASLATYKLYIKVSKQVNDGEELMKNINNFLSSK